MKIVAWQINANTPVKLETTAINLEKQLEEWIEADPNLLKSGLEIVGRQLSVDAGFIDLMAVDSQGRWIVIEIKKGQIDRKTIAQVLDYASCISVIPKDELITKTNAYLNGRGKSIETILKDRSAGEVIEAGKRDIELVVVGVGKSNGLDRMTTYLADQYEMSISVVSFNVFQTSSNGMLLVRELSEPEAQPQINGTKPQNTIEQICELADAAGVGESFRAILAVATEQGLYPRPYKKSIMYTPPTQRNRMLFTVWAEKQNGGLKMYAGPKEFAEFYPLAEEEASSILGMDSSGWRSMGEKQVNEFLAGIKELFESIGKESDSS